MSNGADLLAESTFGIIPDIENKPCMYDASPKPKDQYVIRIAIKREGGLRVQVARVGRH